MIEVRSVAFEVNNRKLVDTINFTAQSGTHTVFLGANGAGKSTLLKLISGDLQPTAGEILYNQLPISSISNKELAKRRGILMQQNTVSMAFSVEELVMMGRYPHFGNDPSKQDWEIVHASMAETKTEHLAKRSYQTLSGGEQQRVQLARVLAQIHEAKDGILLLDEPTTGLDLKHQNDLLLITQKLTNKGFCVISILHDLNLASRFADQIILLKNGKMMQSGHPNDVINFENIQTIFEIEAQFFTCQFTQRPLVIPTLGNKNSILK